MNKIYFFRTAYSKRWLTLIAFVITIVVIVDSLPVVSISAQEVMSPAAQENFSDAELDQLLSPIALYPDPLLAQVIPAATFVDQIERAESLLGGKTNDNLISTQSWDVSVKAVAHYPQVLQMMSSQTDWTTALGQAYVYQSTDVARSIQRLRLQAKNSGALISTPEQQVIVEKEVIKVVPAQPQVIYVPQYDPQVVYVESSNGGVSTGAAIAATAIAFGTGLAIGAWMNRDWDWHGRGPYYHGWAGGGWIGNSRSYVNIHNNIYVNRNFNNININHNVTNRNISNFRADINNRARNDQRLDINRAVNSRDFNRNNSGNRNRINNDTRINNNRLNNTGSRSGLNRTNTARPGDRTGTGSKTLNRNWKNESSQGNLGGKTLNAGTKKNNAGRPGTARPNVNTPKTPAGNRSVSKPGPQVNTKERKIPRPSRGQIKIPRRRG
jgi:hypothetical protein